MAFLGPVVLLFLPLVTFYFQCTGAGDVKLNEHCNSITHCQDPYAMCFGICKCKENKSSCTSPMKDKDCNTTSQCNDGNVFCDSTCICKDAFYENNNHVCADRIPATRNCGSVADKNGSCVVNAFCNDIGVCECGNNFMDILSRCVDVLNSSSSVKTTVQPTVPKYTPGNTSKSTGVKAPKSDSSGSTGKIALPTSTPGVKAPKSDSSGSTGKTTLPTSTPGVKAPKSDSSGSTGKTTLPTSTQGNSAATVAVVEISAYIFCFMLAYFNVPN